MKLPRKLKKKIPKGLYCYELNGKMFKRWNKEVNDFVTVYKAKSCPFSTQLQMKDLPDDIHKQLDKNNEYPEEYVEFCKLLKTDIMDSCKECEIKKLTKLK